MKVLADTSGIIALLDRADRHRIQNLLTLDRRHFNVIQSSQFSHFVLLP
ncbi:hypothetical protein PN441_16665 [Spirulina major CS-329]|nr:hypothetical protein [Spirulina major]MDB9504713.1 hypothetical protein [Spirulina major CS-329]